MQPYPSELKEVVLECVLSGEISLNAASQTDKLGFAAVRKWRDNALTFSMPASLAPYYGLGKGTLQTQKVDCRCALILGGLTETFSALTSEDIYPQRKRQNAPSCSRFFTQVHRNAAIPHLTDGICQDTSKKLVRSLFTPEEPQQGLCPYASLSQDIF